MQAEVRRVLAQLERECDFRVLFACESGSRAWGFASPDSDYDVRFIYAKPHDWYLRINEGRDVCERMLPGDLDVSGWELRKSLRLLAGTNVALYEWLGSPIVYQSSEEAKRIIDLIPTFFNPRKAMFHHLSMARGIHEKHMDGTSVNIKKLFYILRPLLACSWIESRLSMPPTSFHEIVAGLELPSELSESIQDYLAKKEKAAEGASIQVNEYTANWITERIASIGPIAEKLPQPDRGDTALLDQILRDIVKQK